MALRAVVVSGCALGFNCRWNCKAVHTDLQLEQNILPMPVCPEMVAGLGCPRPWIQLRGGDGHAFLAGKARVVNAFGVDMSQRLMEAGNTVLEFCLQNRVKTAYLLENSPSCGVNFTWIDGQLRPGSGVVAALLARNHIRVIPLRKL